MSERIRNHTSASVTPSTACDGAAGALAWHSDAERWALAGRVYDRVMEFSRGHLACHNIPLLRQAIDEAINAEAMAARLADYDGVDAPGAPMPRPSGRAGAQSGNDGVQNLQGRAVRSARVAHTHEVAGSNPAPATIRPDDDGPAVIEAPRLVGLRADGLPGDMLLVLDLVRVVLTAYGVSVDRIDDGVRSHLELLIDPTMAAWLHALGLPQEPVALVSTPAHVPSSAAERAP